MGRARNAVARSSISSHRRETWDLLIPRAECLHQRVDRARRHPLHVSLLDHRGQRLLSGTPRLQECGEVAALAQLRDPEIHRAGTRLPRPVPVSVTVVQPRQAALAVAGAAQALDLQRHETLRYKPDHLAQKVGIRALLNKLLKGNSIDGHRHGLLGQVAGSATPTLPETGDDHPGHETGAPPLSWRSLRQAGLTHAYSARRCQMLPTRGPNEPQTNHMVGNIGWCAEA